MFLKELKTTQNFVEFTKVRKEFESLLLANREFTTTILHRFGSGARSSTKVKDLYTKILDLMHGGRVARDVVEELKNDVEFAFLFAEPLTDPRTPGARAFSE